MEEHVTFTKISSIRRFLHSMRKVIWWILLLDTLSALSECLWNLLSALSECLWNLLYALSECLWNLLSALSGCLWNLLSALSECLWNLLSALSKCLWNDDSSVTQHNKKILENLTPGDLVQFSRRRMLILVYYHWGVYIGDDQIVHKIKRQKGVDGNDIIQANFWQVAAGSKAEINNFLDNIFTPSPGKEVVKRATDAIGKSRYNIVFHNCEHFATHCRYNKNCSKQVICVSMGTMGTFSLGALLSYKCCSWEEQNKITTNDIVGSVKKREKTNDTVYVHSKDETSDLSKSYPKPQNTYMEPESQDIKPKETYDCNDAFLCLKDSDSATQCICRPLFRQWITEITYYFGDVSDSKEADVPTGLKRKMPGDTCPIEHANETNLNSQLDYKTETSHSNMPSAFSDNPDCLLDPIAENSHLICRTSSHTKVMNCSKSRFDGEIKPSINYTFTSPSDCNTTPTNSCIPTPPTDFSLLCTPTLTPIPCPPPMMCTPTPPIQCPPTMPYTPTPSMFCNLNCL